MRILLIGEYSRLHNSLKEGLVALGHNVTIAGDGDDFKNYPVDIPLKVHYTKGVLLFFKKVLLKLFKEDITSLSIRRQFNKVKHQLKDYDVVQLINENAFNCVPKIERELLNYVFANNHKVFLLSCGNDYISVSYAYEQKFRYSILTPYFKGKLNAKTFNYSLKYISKPYINLHQFIFKNIKGVIASDFDYHIPMFGHEKYLRMVPNPINTDTLIYNDLHVDGKIVIFHGINDFNYYKKGNDIFEEALDIIHKKYADKIEVITVRSLPYNEYIQSFDKAHIVLDQIYAYDQGYNALEAMAKGKVVFTGAEQEWLDYYQLREDTVAINAIPDTEKIAGKLEWLILNPHKIEDISRNARAFIEKEHHYKKIAERYLSVWNGF